MAYRYASESEHKLTNEGAGEHHHPGTGYQVPTGPNDVQSTYVVNQNLIHDTTQRYVRRAEHGGKGVAGTQLTSKVVQDILWSYD